MIKMLFSLVPGRILLQCLLGFLIAALVLIGFRTLTDMDIALLSDAWWAGLVLAAFLIVFDAVWVCGLPRLSVQRRLSGNLALGSKSPVKLRFDNPCRRRLRFECVDHYPEEITAEGLPASLDVPAGEYQILEYSSRPVSRGAADFGNVEVRVQSPLGFWRRQYELPAQQTVKIYPNFMALSNLNFLDYEQRLAHLGAHLSQRRGSGQEFKQLREYQLGDEIRQIDWKATARQQRLVSREYQEERDQEVVFMLDAGRRMRATDGELSHFDHSLNALLLTAYIALSGGDSVGVLGFADRCRWVRPVKGRQGINLLLNNLYDLHSSPDASDIVQAAGTLMQHQQKRSLIVIVTNLRDDDSDDLQLAIKIMSRKHLVMLACLRESYLDEALPQQADTQDALNFCARELYREQRQEVIKRLQGQGVITIDAPPQRLHVALLEQYLLLKRAGKL